MKRITFIILMGIFILFAIAPWIRIQRTRDLLIAKNCPVGRDDDGASCFYNSYNNTSVIHLPFVVIINNNVPSGWPGTGPSKPTTIVVTALGTVHKVK